MHFCGDIKRIQMFMINENVVALHTLIKENKLADIFSLTKSFILQVLKD